MLYNFLFRKGKNYVHSVLQTNHPATVNTDTGKMKQKIILFSGLVFIGLLLLSTISCHNTNTQNSGKQKKTVIDTAAFSPGVVYTSVKCLLHTDESYALVLPKNYDTGKKFPVIFFFDAQARGWLPVKRYQPLADSFGFILAASNNSKNGLTAQERNRIVYNFMEDVEQRFSIDPQRIYTGGFSGGARIAAGIGLSNPNIAGTIGCAAGFPQLNNIANSRLAYVGIVGNTDFNYLEMKRLSDELETARWHHCLLVFNGHHQWPPLPTMEKAFYFLQTDAMRRKFIPIDSSIILLVKNTFEKERTKAIRNKDMLLLLQTDWQAVTFLSGLTDVSLYRKEMDRLLQNPQLKKQKEQQVILKKEEEKWQQLYTRALENRNIDWWKKALQNLADMEKAALTPDKKQMVRRLHNYLSLMAYLYADGSLKSHHPEAAKKFLMIYETVDPKNPEVYFLEAQRFAMTGQTKAILSALQKAADNGFHDAKRLENNAYFAGLHQISAFQKILLQVKNNPEKE